MRRKQALMCFDKHRHLLCIGQRRRPLLLLMRLAKPDRRFARSAFSRFCDALGHQRIHGFGPAHGAVKLGAQRILILSASS